jgi:hypothetical protein
MPAIARPGLRKSGGRPMSKKLRGPIRSVETGN